MLLKDALKEFLLECKLRQYSDRTIRHEKNSNTAMFTYVEREYGIIKLEDLRSNAISIYGKGKKPRYVPITPAIDKWLMKYLLARENYIKDKCGYKEDYLFLSQKGKPLTKATVEKIVKDCKIPCGARQEIRCSPHTCRHYYAQKQLRNGCDVYTVSRILGHQNIMITKRYLQSIQDQDILNIGMKTSPLIALKIK